MMELEIVKRQENAFLNRTEINFMIKHDYEGGITREKVREKICAVLSAQKDCVVIDSMRSEFGKPVITGYAKIYCDKKSCMANERNHILVRNKLKEPDKKADKKPAAGKPAEKTETSA